MSYWNHFSARSEDLHRTGIPSYDGYPGFDGSVDGRVDLQTDITPLTGPRVVAAADAGAASFGRADCRDLEFTTEVPTRYHVGREVRIEGRVTATDQRFHSMALRFVELGSAEMPRFDDDVSASGSFSPRVRFREGEEGLYYLQVFLFWPDGPPQWPRCTLSPVVVAP
jgi:hypothetical protein